MGKLLCTLTTRERPDRFEDMLRSFNATKSADTDLVVYIDNNDPKLEEYNIDAINVVVGDRRSLFGIHNEFVNKYKEYDYYMPINDDIIFETHGWDSKLIDIIEEKGAGWGISYGDDLAGNVRHELPTFGMVSGNIVKTLGYIYPPALHSTFGDTFLLDFGKSIGRLFYNKDVIIKHIRHDDYINDYRAEKDFVTKERRAYANYIDNYLERDTDKIFDALSVGVT